MVYESKWPSACLAVNGMSFVDFDDSDSSSQFRSSAGLPRGDVLACKLAQLGSCAQRRIGEQTFSVDRAVSWH
jgi:hypothetical protein